MPTPRSPTSPSGAVGAGLLLRVLAVLVVLLLPGVAQAGAEEPVVQLTGEGPRVPLVPRTVLLDPQGVLTPAEALRRLTAPDAEVESGVYSRGYIPDTLWARIVIDVAPEAAGRWYLSLELPNFDRLAVYTVPEGAGADPVPFATLGDSTPPATDVRTRFHVAPMDLAAGRTVLLVHGRTGSTMTLDLKLWKLDALLAEEQGFFALQTFYLGIVAILLLGAVGLFVHTVQPIYAIYAVTLIAHAIFWLLLNGTGPGHLWPSLAGRVHFDHHPLVAFTLFGTAAFSAHFLSTSRVPRFIHRGLWWIAYVGLALGALCAVVPDDQVYRTSTLLSIIVVPVIGLLCLTTAVGLYKGEPAARPLMLTWVALSVAVAIAWMRDLGLVPSNVLTLTGPQLGTVCEMIIFAYMLVHRLGRLQAEKEQLQREALAAAREQEMALERRVADRTAELDAANVRLRSIVSSAPFPLALIRQSDGHVVYANQRLCNLLQSSSEAVVGHPGGQWLVDPAWRDRLLVALDRTGVVEDREIELKRQDGTPFWALMSVVSIVYDGEPVRVVALNDITRRKRLEQDLRQTAQLEAEAAERERSARRLQQQFVAMVSHEFRTPLAIIDGAAQNIEMSDARGRGRLQKIRGAVRRLLRMIDTCLIDERVDGGTIVLQRETVDLGELLEEAADVIRAASADHVVAVEVPMEAVTVKADPRLAEIAVNNLLENAVKYSPSGTTVTLRLAPTPSGGADVEVVDQGPGIPDADRDRIFEKYYRAENTSGTAGAGLGLHLVRAIMEAHGGRVGCVAGVARGSRFVLRFPADETSPAIRAVAAPAG